MAFKRLPTDKTIVTEVKIQLVDQFTKNRLITESIAAKITQPNGVKTGDSAVTNTQPITLSNIQSVVMIQSWAPLVLTINYGSGQLVDVPCSGLFLFYGTITSIEIKGTTIDLIRISYVYA